MQEEELKAYQGLKNQLAFLLKSPIYRLVVASTKLPNLTIIIPVGILVTTTEYNNQRNYIPELYMGPNILERQSDYYQQDIISDKLFQVIIF
jgi:hypothetical protein